MGTYPIRRCISMSNSTVQNEKQAQWTIEQCTTEHTETMGKLYQRANGELRMRKMYQEYNGMMRQWGSWIDGTT